MTNPLNKLYDDICDVLGKTFGEKQTKALCKSIEQEVTDLAKKSNLFKKVKVKCESMDNYLAVNMYHKASNKEDFKVTEFRFKVIRNKK